MSYLSLVNLYHVYILTNAYKTVLYTGVTSNLSKEQLSIRREHMAVSHGGIM